MSVKQVGTNSAEEFFESILYGVGYVEAQKVVQGFTKDIDNPVLREAVNDSMNVLVFGIMMYASL